VRPHSADRLSLRNYGFGKQIDLASRRNAGLSGEGNDLMCASLTEYEQWVLDTQDFYNPQVTNTRRFRDESQEVDRLRARQPVSPTAGVSIVDEWNTLTLIDRSYDPPLKLGTLSYAMTNASSLNLRLPFDENGMAIFNTMSDTNGNKVLSIYGFYSKYDKSIKGIGSRLLRGLLELAEIGDCGHIVVENSINDPVYESFGFKPIGYSNFYMSREKLKKRLARGLMPLPACRVASAEAPW
jgi:hypothetical protein